MSLIAVGLLVFIGIEIILLMINASAPFLMVPVDVATTYILTNIGIAVLFTVLCRFSLLEDIALAILLSVIINSIFSLHPVFNIIIFLILLIGFHALIKKYSSVEIIKSVIFTSIYLIVGWTIIYKTMGQLDLIWQTFFFALFTFFVIFSRVATIKSKHSL